MIYGYTTLAILVILFVLGVRLGSSHDIGVPMMSSCYLCVLSLGYFIGLGFSFLIKFFNTKIF